MKSKFIVILGSPGKIISQMDDFSKIGMHMTQSTLMMVGSGLQYFGNSPGSWSFV